MTRLEYIASELIARKQKITCAESCTGGLLAAELTSIAGSSAFFERAYITYSNQAKEQLVNVNSDTLRHYGAVSEEVVREMALGALIAAKSDYALSISGIAGPDGGDDEKPVGLVFIGCYMNDRVTVEEHRFQGDRTAVRTQAVQSALRLLRATILENTKA